MANLRPNRAAWTLRRRLGVFAAIALLSACSSVKVRYPDGTVRRMSEAEFADYVQRVFRYHNHVMNDLIVEMSLRGDDDLLSSRRVVRAEDHMAVVCRPLNDAVTASMEGHMLGFSEKLKLPSAVPACEQATRALEKLLPPSADAAE